MESYYVESLDDRATYIRFIDYMLARSAAFSVVYFKYHEAEKTKKSTLEIKKRLDPYKLWSRNVSKWPGTETMNKSGHIYRLIIYKSDAAVSEFLKVVETLYEWDYPRYPMDLAFYRDGYAWFASSAHEGLNWLYTDDTTIVKQLSDCGIAASKTRSIEYNKLFLLPDPIFRRA